ncbi:MAG: enoyl-CoA hydratase/isomerase family protein [Pseudomonadota bacterium]
MYAHLTLETTGSIATLSLNRPERLNALSLDTLRELEQAAKAIALREDVRAVVVAGKGRSFSAGADLSGFPAPATKGARAAADAGRRMADAVEAIPQITIARIQGWCVGGGLVIAAACDLRVATKGTRFSIPEVDLGIPLAWGGIPRLVREIGPALTKELVITCRPFDAHEALGAGFLNHVVEDEELDSKVNELADAVARRARFPVQATKRHVDAVTSTMVGLERAWADADSLLAGLQEPECIEAREAYLSVLAEKRSGG